MALHIIVNLYFMREQSISKGISYCEREASNKSYEVLTNYIEERVDKLLCKIITLPRPFHTLLFKYQIFNLWWDIEK